MHSTTTAVYIMYHTLFFEYLQKKNKENFLYLYNLIPGKYYVIPLIIDSHVSFFSFHHEDQHVLHFSLVSLVPLFLND